MTRHTRHKRAGVWLAAIIATLVTLSAGCTGDAADGAAPEAVRNAAEEHVRDAGGEMVFDDPTGDARLTLTFDHVHDGVKATHGEAFEADLRTASGGAGFALAFLLLLFAAAWLLLRRCGQPTRPC